MDWQIDEVPDSDLPKILRGVFWWGVETIQQAINVAGFETDTNVMQHAKDQGTLERAEAVAKGLWDEAQRAAGDPPKQDALICGYARRVFDRANGYL